MCVASQSCRSGESEGCGPGARRAALPRQPTADARPAAPRSGIALTCRTGVFGKGLQRLLTITMALCIARKLHRWHEISH